MPNSWMIIFDVLKCEEGKFKQMYKQINKNLLVMTIHFCVGTNHVLTIVIVYGQNERLQRIAHRRQIHAIADRFGNVTAERQETAKGQHKCRNDRANKCSILQRIFCKIKWIEMKRHSNYLQLGQTWRPTIGQCHRPRWLSVCRPKWIWDNDPFAWLDWSWRR